MKITALGEHYDLVSADELNQHTSRIEKRFDTFIRDLTRGLKVMRLGPAAGTTDASGNVSITLQGPRSGYIWEIRRIAVAGNTADSVTVYRSTDGTTNPNQYLGVLPLTSYGALGSKSTFLMPDESLVIVGTALSTKSTTLTVTGEAIEVPAEMIGKLL